MPTIMNVTCDGRKVRVISRGKGIPLLFLHGAAGAQWLPFHDILADHFEVFLPEHPGFGESEEPRSIASVADLARHYRLMLTALDIDTAHVIGSSFGGWLASELAVMHPSSLRSLTLIGPAGLFPRLAKPGVPPTREVFTRSLYFDQSIADVILAQELTDGEIAIQSRNRAAVARFGGSTFHNPRLAENLSQLDVASFLVWGADDRLVPSEQAATWGQYLRAPLWIIPACGHLPHIEQAEPTARWILAHLAKISGR